MKYLKDFWRALESGFRAGLRQYRKRRTELARAARLPDPFTEQT